MEKNKATENLRIMGIVFGVIFVIALGIVGVKAAYDFNNAPKNLIQNSNVVIHEATENLGGESQFGSTASTSDSTITPYNDILYRGCNIAMDDDNFFSNNRTNTYWDCYENLSFTDATSTQLSWLNNKGQVVWVEPKTAVQITAMATNTIKIIIGTSTNSYMTIDDSDVINALEGNTANKYNSILKTGSISGVSSIPTSTLVYSGFDYPGADTRDNSGTRFLVPVLPDQYILVIGTSTSDAITNSSNVFDGVLHLRYSLLNP